RPRLGPARRRREAARPMGSSPPTAAGDNLVRVSAACARCGFSGWRNRVFIRWRAGAERRADFFFVIVGTFGPAPAESGAYAPAERPLASPLNLLLKEGVFCLRTALYARARRSRARPRLGPARRRREAARP